MLNYFKFIELLICLQSIFISSMLPVFISVPIKGEFKTIIEIPITWQIPTIIIISLLFKGQMVQRALSIYLLLGIFIVPIFPHGGSLGYLLTPNFGYLIGIYPLVQIINNLNRKNRISTYEFLSTGIIAICALHIIGIIYNFLQMLYFKQIDIFLYNIGNYSLGKIGYHFLMLLPITILIKPINYIKTRN